MNVVSDKNLREGSLTPFFLKALGGIVLPWFLTMQACAEGGTCPKNGGQCVDLFVVDATVNEVIDAITNETGARIEVDGRIPSVITHKHVGGTLEGALKQLSAHASLDMFEFNGVTYVSHGDNIVSRIIRLGNLSLSDVMNSLEDAGLEGDPFAAIPTAGNSAVVLTGPPKMVAFGEVLIESLPDPLSEPAIFDRVVRVRRGTNVTIEPLLDEKRYNAGSIAQISVDDTTE